MLADDGKYVHSEGDGNWWIPSGQIFYSPNPADGSTPELAFAREHFFLPHRFQDPFAATSLVRYGEHDLLLLETKDPLGNKVRVGERDEQGNVTNGNDYRVLQPKLVTDPNRNRTEVAFDALGMVVGTAVMGKLEETVGDSLNGFNTDLTQDEIDDHLANPLADPHAILGRATTRLVYDLFAYHSSKDQPDPQPSVVYTLARETHDADLAPGQQTKIQHSFSYSDGFGRAIQQKVQAEPGPVPRHDANGEIIVDAGGQPEMTTDDVAPRWVGSGWTVFNNKGKPVRQYEPFFTDRHTFEFDVRIGVSPILFYDPVERVVATLHPNHTYEKVVFDPWQQTTWDVNDTVAPSGTQTGDPRTDPDIAGFVEAYFKTRPATWETWHAQRITGGLGMAEEDAATKAAAHADTPAKAFLDSLGRPFLTVADNGPRGQYETRVDLDIEGNQRAVIDVKGRTVMRYGYDMLSNQVRQDSMEAGRRWGLPNVAGNPIYRWDSRDHRLRTTYDELQRPTQLFLQEAGGGELLVERTVYGESQGDDKNHNGQVFQQFDGAGVVTFEEYDFKGNLRSSTRQFAQDYKNTPDWDTDPALEADDTFTTSTEYDALNRPTAITTPDDSVTRPTYNEANLLERLDVNLRGAGTATNFVADIDYNARGQRTLIEYGNGVTTTYDYDDQTFRLTNLNTTRSSDGDLQNLHYAYDPAGNITSIRDQAQQTIFFDNAVVEPHAGYTYDAVYQLIEATGREHIGQTGTAPHTTWNDEQRTVFNIPHPNNPQAMRRYREQYEYDEVGNFLRLVHTASNNGSWNRTYHYEEPSLLEPLQQNNRLTRAEVGSITEPYFHDAHGNMTQMPHLSQMDWDYKDQFQRADLGGGGTAYYVYDASGQRVRKIIERQNGTRQKERLYLGGFEIYREYNGGGTEVTLERETLHIMDDQQRIALVETKTFESGLLPRLRSLFGSLTPLIRYQLSNHLGSASLELDEQAKIISYEEYYPYSSTSYQAGRSQVEAQLKRYRYTGMERDEENGLNYHGARYYAPWLGRWQSADPLGTFDGANLYRYSKSNPVMFRDSTGMQSTDGLVFTYQIDLSSGEPEGVYYDPKNDTYVSLPGTLGPGGTFTPLQPDKSTKPSQQLGSKHGNAKKDDTTGKVIHGAKPEVRGPAKNTVIRKDDPKNKLTKKGFKRTDPKASNSPGEHALGEHLDKPKQPSQHISASENPRGAPKYKGKKYWIDIDKAKKAGVEYITNAELEEHLDDQVQSGRFDKGRVDNWKIDQVVDHEKLAKEPTSKLKDISKRGGEMEGVFTKNDVPAAAVETGAMRIVKRLAQGVGAATTAIDVGNAIIESIEQGSIKPLAAEVIRQVGAWGGAALAIFLVGLLSTPVGWLGMLIGFAVGSLGGIGGYLGSDYLADQIWAN